jgi:FkbM family methyltransferase
MTISMKKARKWLGGFKAKYFAQNQKLVNISFANHDLKLVKGTIRLKPDKDDAWFFQLAKHSSVILDIGANIGFTSIMACLSNPHSKIVLVEPNPEALSIAAKNLVCNNFAHRCVFYTGLLSDKSGVKVKLYTVGAGAAGSIFRQHAHTASQFNSYIWLTTSTIDDVIHELQVMPDFIKIDVEGAESMVLNGAIELAKRKNSRFVVEMHGSATLPMQTNAQSVLDWCVRTKYKAWYLKDETPLTDSKHIAHRGKCHLLLQPEEWPYPSYLEGITEGAVIEL